MLVIASALVIGVKAITPINTDTSARRHAAARLGRRIWLLDMTMGIIRGPLSHLTQINPSSVMTLDSDMRKLVERRFEFAGLRN